MATHFDLLRWGLASFFLGAIMSGCAAPYEEEEFGPATTELTTAEFRTEYSVPLRAKTLLGVHTAGDPYRADSGFQSFREMMTTSKPTDAGVQAEAVPGFVAEVVYARGSPWSVESDAYSLRRIVEASGSELLLRVDYSRDANIPPPNGVEDGGIWNATDLYVHYVVHELLPRVADIANVIIIGNEPNIADSCLRDDPAFCAPIHYANIYWRLRDEALRRFPGKRFVFAVAGMSPGEVNPDWPVSHARYLSSYEYYRLVLKALSPTEVDAIAIHAYGDGPEAVNNFVRWGIEAQLEPFRQTGYGRHPIFLTEMHRPTWPGTEQKTVAFARGAFAALEEHNRTSSPPIVSACWYVMADAPPTPFENITYSLNRLPAVRSELHAHALPLPPGRSAVVLDATQCPCAGGNYCNHPPKTPGCPMTFPGGYCDPNGDLSYTDGDWARGICESGCPCVKGNYCNHPPRTAGCAMTAPGGYCDPNGDRSYIDGDWAQGICG